MAEQIMTADTLKAMLAEALDEVRQIKPRDLLECLPRVTVIDVREQRELLDGYLPGASNVPRGRLEFDVDVHPGLSDRAQDIVLYSNAGMRSLLAAQTLKRLGYSKVASLSGGIDGWLDIDLPVE